MNTCNQNHFEYNLQKSLLSNKCVWEHLVSFPDQYTKLLMVWASDSENETDVCFRDISIAICSLI